MKEFKPRIVMSFLDTRDTKLSEIPSIDLFKRERIIEVNAPFVENEQYKDIANIRVSGFGKPSDINHETFDCTLSISRKGKLELTYKCSR